MKPPLARHPTLPCTIPAPICTPCPYLYRIRDRDGYGIGMDTGAD